MVHLKTDIVRVWFFEIDSEEVGMLLQERDRMISKIFDGKSRFLFEITS